MTIRDNNHQSHPRPACPSCRSMFVMHDGKTKGRFQRYRCKVCERRFTPDVEVKKWVGVKALPCREREFKSLTGRPDPKMEHWKLCMEIRR